MSFKEIIDSVRTIPLGDIFNRHGLLGVRAGNSIRYKNETMNIVVTGNKWYDNKLAHGGVGPIDLVIHLRKCPFKDAVLWLAGKECCFPLDQQTPPEPARQMPYWQAKEEYALRDENRWPEARSYLINKRCLKSEIVDAFHKKGDIYATSRGGIVFIHRNVDGEEVGLSSRSIDHESNFRQSLGRKSIGWFAVGDLNSAKKIVIVESAIDALSFVQLYPIEPTTSVVAVSGAFTPLSLLKHALKNQSSIVAAYDNDVAGLKAKDQLYSLWKDLTHGHGEFDQKIPIKKDWNEDLSAKEELKKLNQYMNIENTNNYSTFPIEAMTDNQGEFSEQLGFVNVKKKIPKKTETLEEKLERLEKEFPDDTESKENSKQLAVVPKEVQLPLWHEDARAQANSLIRSALFTATSPNAKRDHYEKLKIASVEGIEILYTGTQLNQSDADVIDTVLHICRRTTLGLECRVTGYRLLKLLNKKDSKQNYVILDRQLTRMVATAIRIRVDKRWSYEGSLIQNIRRDEINGDYLISLNPTISQLFQEDQYTLINHRLLMALQRNPLAQWAVRYFSSHAEPYPMKFKTIRDLSGSKITALRSFRQAFKKAIEKIDKEHQNLCQQYEDYRKNTGVEKWEAIIDEKADLVTIIHPKSKSQKKHMHYKKAHANLLSKNQC